MAIAADIEYRAQRVREQSPSLNTGSRITAQQHDSLYDLAIMAGLTEALANDANDADLISIFLVALKDGEGAKRTAQKIAMRLDDTLLGTPTPQWTPPRDPGKFPDPRTQPTPSAPQEPQHVDMSVIRGMIKTEVREGALGPLQTALDTIHDELTGRIDNVSVEIETNVLGTMRPPMRNMARDAAEEALKSLTPTRLEITRPDTPEITQLGLVHRETAKIINALSAGVNVYLHGPAGSGKTTVARKCAQAFGLQFYFMAKVESEYQFTGFIDAKGDTVRSQFRDAYEHGGVFLFDEMDASSPSAVVALNAALANGICSFPDGIVQRHKDFYCIGAGNTKLTGANRQYAGRNQLDAASIDRFAFIEFGYDDDLERALATDGDWVTYVQRARYVVTERGLNHLITPRATYDGCKLLAAGFDRETVATMMIFKGLDADTITQIKGAI